MKRTPHLYSGSAFKGMRIGLLGGSFNPAHEGHVHISLLAMKEMRLDYVWWLVSPQNPLKETRGMASLKQRMKDAEAITATHPRIIVTDIETQLDTRFTADTLKKLQARFPSTSFIWMMGADNLLQIPRWQRWQEIFRRVDVAVFRRPPYVVGVLRGMAARRFGGSRIQARKARFLGYEPVKGGQKYWALFANRLNAESATQIRMQRDKKK